MCNKPFYRSPKHHKPAHFHVWNRWIKYQRRRTLCRNGQYRHSPEQARLPEHSEPGSHHPNGQHLLYIWCRCIGFVCPLFFPERSQFQLYGQSQPLQHRLPCVAALVCHGGCIALQQCRIRHPDRRRGGRNARKLYLFVIWRIGRLIPLLSYQCLCTDQKSVGRCESGHHTGNSYSKWNTGECHCGIWIFQTCLLRRLRSTLWIQYYRKAEVGGRVSICSLPSNQPRQ